MKATAIFLASLLFAGSATLAGEQAAPANDPDRSAEAPDPSAQTVEVEKGDFIRKVVITIEGDEIGVIRDVGYITAIDEPVAIVDVDAYIGIGEKRIAIPLSRFDSSATNPDSVTTVLTRQGIETAREVGESDFTPLE